MSLANYLFIYVGGLVVSILLSLIALGFEKGNSSGIEPIFNAIRYFAMSFMWPLTCAAYIIIGFVSLPYKFGEWLAKETS